MIWTKIITIVLLDPLSVGSGPWTDLPSAHTRARNGKSGGRTTKSGEKGTREGLTAAQAEIP